MQKVVKLTRVKLVPWPSFNWITNIHNDNIKLFLSIFKPFLCIRVFNTKSRILISTIIPFWKLFTANITSNLVNINHDTFLHTFVSQNLTRSSEFTTTSNKNGFGIFMKQHGWVNQRLVVDVLICLCALGLTVHNQSSPKLFGFDHLNTLKVRPSVKQNTLHRKMNTKHFSQALCKPKRVNFIGPFLLDAFSFVALLGLLHKYRTLRLDNIRATRLLLPPRRAPTDNCRAKHTKIYLASNMPDHGGTQRATSHHSGREARIHSERNLHLVLFSHQNKQITLVGPRTPYHTTTETNTTLAPSLL
mmetsp:Transcript_23865/g.38036  ORF Transcript_23865/g.38036 Transcript_23865/m.38036 type:complete len:303 (-) Transcript_23865:66-974(-)